MQRSGVIVAAVLFGMTGWLPNELYASVGGIELEKTVGLDPSVCATTNSITVTAGTDVTYCYTLSNTSFITLREHTVVDDKLGVILSNFFSTLAPSASLSVTRTATINATTLNVATWTASEFSTSGASTDDGGAGQGRNVTISTTDDALVNVAEFSTEPDAGPDGCTDGVDNDQDGTTDCGDVDCVGIGPCAAPAPVLGPRGFLITGLILLSIGASSLVRRRNA